MINTPACHGHWAGYRTSKTIASVIDIGVSKPAWLARYKDQVRGPLPLKEAKAAALVMAKGTAGDYRTMRPTGHLDGLAARLPDREITAGPNQPSGTD
jgi:hypothetical protein